MDRKLVGVGFGTDQATPNAPTGKANITVTTLDHLGLAREYLSARGIPPEVADAAHIYAVADARAELGSEFAALPAIVFPYSTFDGEPDWIEIDGEETQFFRVRYLREPVAQGFIKRKAPRFQQLKDSGVHVYLPPQFDWRAIAAIPSIHVVVTEGECKALSLAARAVPAIGLGGVDGIWRRIDNDHREFHPVLAEFKWGGRETAIVFDSDIAEKPNVLAAEGRLVEQLTLRSAMVRPVRLPAGDAR